MCAKRWAEALFTLGQRPYGNAPSNFPKPTGFQEILCTGPGLGANPLACGFRWSRPQTQVWGFLAAPLLCLRSGGPGQLVLQRKWAGTDQSGRALLSLSTPASAKLCLGNHGAKPWSRRREGSLP